MKRFLFFISVCMTMLAQGNPSFRGDLRYRLENIDEDSNETRFRHRVRARIGAYGQAQDNLKYGIRLASGPDNPISTNQSLDSGFSNKQINFDMFYLNYHRNDSSCSLVAGKFKNNFFRPGKSELIWDGDLTPEGVSYSWKYNSFFINLGYLILEERSSESDTNLHGMQLGYKSELDSVSISFGISYFDYIGLEGKAPLYDSTDSFGNTLSNGNYANDFNLLEGFFELKFKNYPLTIFIDYVDNGEADEKGTGWLAGFKAGKKLKFAYSYRNVEADAIIGAFTDSDFKGGGTDGKGHEINLSYPMGEAGKVYLSHFMNETLVDNGNDYSRTMLDFSLVF